MTDRKNAIEELLDKVESGSWDCKFPQSGLSGLRSAKRYRNAAKAYNGSLDAAKALHDAVLPGRDWILTNQASHADEPEGPMAAIHNGEDDPFEGSGDDPARAWLIAILRALIAMEDGV